MSMVFENTGPKYKNKNKSSSWSKELNVVIYFFIVIMLLVVCEFYKLKSELFWFAPHKIVIYSDSDILLENM